MEAWLLPKVSCRQCLPVPASCYRCWELACRGMKQPERLLLNFGASSAFACGSRCPECCGWFSLCVSFFLLSATHIRSGPVWFWSPGGRRTGLPSRRLYPSPWQFWPQLVEGSLPRTDGHVSTQLCDPSEPEHLEINIRDYLKKPEKQ